MSLKAAIIDYGMGNLFSVEQAWKKVGVESFITHEPCRLKEADVLVLPGMGAFGDAMETLKRLRLAEFLQAWIQKGRPFIGICLGMQLLMTRSFEFGEHEGLGVIPGEVVRFSNGCKVPHIGWNHIYLHRKTAPFFGLESRSYLYFIHSYYVLPKDEGIFLASSQYGETNFCSALHQKNVVAFQFHPERSGPAGLKIYRELADWVRTFNSGRD